jgi:regulatory protein
MQITAIEPRRKSLSALFLDGEFAMNIDSETLLKSGYKLGGDITDEELYELLQASDNRRANEKALYLLEHCNHSKKELVDKIRRTISPQAAQAAAEHMQELGLVNDAVFAKDYAAELLGRKGFSASRAQHELLLKGIDKELAEEIIGELAPEPVEKIKEILARKYERVLGDEKGRRRAVNALQRLGYRYEEIRRALNDYDVEINGDE